MHGFLHQNADLPCIPDKLSWLKHGMLEKRRWVTKQNLLESEALSLQGRMGGTTIDEAFKCADIDNSKHLTYADWQSAFGVSRRLFELADTDQDGKASWKEFRDALASMPESSNKLWFPRFAVMTESNLMLAKPNTEGSQPEGGERAQTVIALESIDCLIFGGQLRQLSTKAHESSNNTADSRNGGSSFASKLPGKGESGSIDVSMGFAQIVPKGLMDKSGAGLGELAEDRERERTRNDPCVLTILCSTRTYTLRAPSVDECQGWGMVLEGTAIGLHQRSHKRWLREHSSAERLRCRLHRLYTSPIMQILMALVVVCTLAFGMLSTTTMPLAKQQQHHDLVQHLHLAIASLFAAEILLNLASNVRTSSASNMRLDMSAWLANGWNLFEVLVVSLSFAFILSHHRSVTFLYYLRALRLVRLAEVLRMQRLQRLVSAVLNALLPVVLAVMLLLLVTCMYAIAATETLHQQSPDHFGTVGESYVTLLQMLTGDAWARQVKLPSLATSAL
jgi:hypothetical protein